MKTPVLLILIASSLLLCGCAATKVSRATDTATPEFAPSTGYCASPWGDLPTYRQPSVPKLSASHRPAAGRGIRGTVVVDILVNRDGSVRDVAVVKSSGNPKTDAAAVASARTYRYTAQIHPDDPAPYVVPDVSFRFISVEGPGQPVSYPFQVN